MAHTKDLSIVISLFNEAESIPELIRWIETVMSSEGYDYEVIMVDDGSTDGSWQIIRNLSEKNPAIRGISFRRNYGKSAALYHGFAAAEGGASYIGNTARNGDLHKRDAVLKCTLSQF